MHTHSKYWMRVKSIWHLYALGVMQGGNSQAVENQKKNSLLITNRTLRAFAYRTLAAYIWEVSVTFSVDHCWRVLCWQVHHCVITDRALCARIILIAYIWGVSVTFSVDHWWCICWQVHHWVVTDRALCACRTLTAYVWEASVTSSVDHCWCVYFDRFTTEWLQTEQQVSSGSWRVSCWATRPPLAGSSHSPSPQPLKL